MTLQIFDTLSGEKRLFQPIDDARIGIYVCGMTVYDRCHLGHGRVMVSFDAITRYLRFRGFDVTYVRNITDVDDKIFVRAHERGIHFRALTDEMITLMQDDEKKLGCLPPDQEPRATDNIDEMLKLIQTLIKKGSAYQGQSGDVYFRVSAFPNYGKLNNRKLDELIAGIRISVSPDKENPADFVLWKAAKENEEAWESPFGAGRPGWHIECSAMSMKALGDNFDIHGGGPDLKFPHHENEIAQSEAATGCHFANYWMHAGAVRVDQKKMSKSLGNFVTLNEISQQYHGDVIRFFLLQSHYRSAISYSSEALDSAETAYTRLISKLPESVDTFSSDEMFKFQELMDDDFNTPRVIAQLFELVSDGTVESLSSAFAIGKVLGLFQTPNRQFLTEMQTLKAHQSNLSHDAVDALVAARQRARTEKDFAKADQIRADLINAGVIIEDGSEGTTWHRK